MHAHAASICIRIQPNVEARGAGKYPAPGTQKSPTQYNTIPRRERGVEMDEMKRVAGVAVMQATSILHLEF